MADNKIPRNKNADKTNVEDRPSGYFLSLSDKYKKASRVIYIMLAISFVLTLLFNAKLLTYTNFNYLFRDLNAAAEAAADNYNSISYTNDEMRVVKNYRGGIITVSSTDMTIYTATGRRTLYLNDSFVSPQISVSKKYAVVYDLGGNKYSVYNSFARVGGETLKYPISYVSVADNGWFAIVSRDAEHASVVYLYDDDLQLRNTYSFASANVFFVDINNKGNRLAIFKTETALDKFSTSVMVCEPDQDSSIFNVVISDGIPYGGGFMESGELQLASTDGYYVIDQSSGKILKEDDFEGRSANQVSVTEEGTAISLSNNKGVVNNSILVFDKNGDLIYNTNIDSGMLDIEYHSGYVFINLGESISRINVKNGDITEVKIFEKGSDIIVYDSNNILLCCQTKAKYIKM